MLVSFWVIDSVTFIYLWIPLPIQCFPDYCGFNVSLGIEIKESFHLLCHFPNDYNGQSWANLNPSFWELLLDFLSECGGPSMVPSVAAFQGVLTDDWIISGVARTRTSDCVICLRHSLWLYPLCHSTASLYFLKVQTWIIDLKIFFFSNISIFKIL